MRMRERGARKRRGVARGRVGALFGAGLLFGAGFVALGCRAIACGHSFGLGLLTVPAKLPAVDLWSAWVGQRP